MQRLVNNGLYALIEGPMPTPSVCQTEIECVLLVLEMIWCQNHDLTPTHVPLFRETLRISTTFPPTDWFIMWIKAPPTNTHPCCTMLSWRIILIIKAIRLQKQNSCQHLVGPGTHTHSFSDRQLSNICYWLSHLFSTLFRVQFVRLQEEQEEDGAGGAGWDEEEKTIVWTCEWISSYLMFNIQLCWEDQWDFSMGRAIRNRNQASVKMCWPLSGQGSDLMLRVLF